MRATAQMSGRSSGTSRRGGRTKVQRGGSLQFEAFRQEIMRREATLAPVRAGGGQPRAVVVYPGPYDEAMASLSVHVLVDLFSRAGWDIERAFDFPGFSGPVRTIETGTPLGDADLLLVTVPFELQIFALARMLQASGIGALASERTGGPVVVCGGPAPTGNPAPWAAIADFVYLGELEAAVGEMIAAVADGGPGALGAVSGMVDRGRLRAGTAQAAERQVAADVDEYVPRSVYLVDGGPFGHRALVEVARGCPHACRFCLARAIYEPHRPRSVAAVAGALEELAAAGAKGVGFIAPSFANHPDAVTIVEEARRLGLSVSAPSLRADVVVRRVELLEALRGGGQETLTLAPEAATERLRRHIGKPLRDEVLFEAVEAGARLGFQQVKLYFMVGLPGEEQEDIVAFEPLFARLAEIARPRMRIAASVACFVPKPQTPFEGERMVEVAQLRRRVSAVERAGRKAGVEVSVESPRLAWAQAAVARGDLSIGELIACSGGKLTAASLVAAAERAGVLAREFAERGHKTHRGEE